jgi:hypothetical protein
MHTVTDDPKRHMRVSMHESHVLELMTAYPKLTRTEVTDAIAARGPLRMDVEKELERLSSLKR